MKTSVSILFTMFLMSRVSFGAEPAPVTPPLRPLDTKTRCIVLLKETLNSVARGDLAFAMPRVADQVGDHYVRFPQHVVATLNEKGKKEFSSEFQHIEEVMKAFDGILYSDLKTDEGEVTLKPVSKDPSEKARLHRITVKVPGIPDGTLSELQFLEAPSGLYWVPFGW